MSHFKDSDGKGTLNGTSRCLFVCTALFLSFFEIAFGLLPAETKGIGSHARSLNSKVPASEVKCKEAKSLYIETRREF